uniref:Uncharacterized protein n=1 Tax=Anopheles coluzzii TaxID=1518534 RepID=A0A8W7Q016_ANOCL
MLHSPARKAPKHLTLEVGLFEVAKVAKVLPVVGQYAAEGGPAAGTVVRVQMQQGGIERTGKRDRIVAPGQLRDRGEHAVRYQHDRHDLELGRVARRGKDGIDVLGEVFAGLAHHLRPDQQRLVEQQEDGGARVEAYVPQVLHGRAMPVGLDAPQTQQSLRESGNS